VHLTGEFVSILSAKAGQVSSGRGAVTGGEIRAWFRPAFSSAMIGQNGGAAREPTGQGETRAAIIGAQPNKRLKLTAHVDYGMNLSPVRCSLSAIR